MSTTYPPPTIVIDTREQLPLPIAGPNIRGTLVSGDYSFVGGEHLFSIERKSLADLVGSLTAERDRFTRELERLRGYRFARLLIIGAPADLAAGNYRSQARPQALVASLAAFEAGYVPVVWAATPEEAASLVEGWAYWCARDVLRTAEFITKARATEAVPVATDR